MKDSIIIHCSATPPSMEVTRETIYKWHVIENGWTDIGYNYMIDRDGIIIGGRDIDGDGNFDEEIGAHARGFNTNSIGICLFGGIDEDGNPEFNFTMEQILTLNSLVNIKVIEYNIPWENVIGHRDVDPDKDCPSFDVKSMFSLQRN